MGFFKKSKSGLAPAVQPLDQEEDIEPQFNDHTCYVGLSADLGGSVDADESVRVQVVLTFLSNCKPEMLCTIYTSPAMSPEFAERAKNGEEVETVASLLRPIAAILIDADSVTGELRTSLHEMAVAQLLPLFDAADQENARLEAEHEAKWAAHTAAIKEKYGLV